jgi:hypothetical protein
MGYVVNREELAWCAGFFDGEGHCGYSQRRKGRGIYISISQVDRHVLDRFVKAVGVGRVRFQKRRETQDVHEYKATSFHDVQAVAAMLWHWLSPIKREQCLDSLRNAPSPRGWMIANCRASGHLIGTRKCDGGDYCVTCNREAVKRNNRKRRGY